MSDLKVLIANRGYAKGSLTRLKKAFRDDKDGFNDMSLEKLHAKRSRLIEVFGEYERFCIRISAEDPELSEDVGEMEETYLDLLGSLDTLINRKQEVKLVAETVHSEKSASRLKLPSVIIPPFTGKYTEYFQFINLFTAMIHKDSSLSPVQKLYYLKSFLSGEPSTLINNLPLQDESYTEALSLLKSRYDSKTKITQEHIYVLLDLPTMTRSNVTNIRTFISEVKQHLAALKNLGEPVDRWDSIMLCILCRKLDINTNRAFQMENSSPKLDELLDFLEKRAKALENTDTSYKPPERLASHATAVATLPAVPASCLYCKCSHKLFKCPRFKLAPIKARLEFAITNKLCFICLSQHKRKCKFHFRCAECKGKDHNSLLHHDASYAPRSVSLSAATQGQILLPTARIKLIAQSGMSIYVRALLDSASQASFVTQKVVDLLQKPSQHSNINIIGITNKQQLIEKSINLDVHSTVYPFKINVNCHIVKNITTKLPQTKVDLSAITFPPNCKLADESFNMPGDVNVLLGADIFFQVLLQQPESSVSASSQVPATSSSAQQPSIVHTAFGHVVAGRSNIPVNSQKKVISLLCTQCDSSISNQLSAFWDSEKVPEIFPEQLPEHEYSEKLFRETTKLENNKYQVTMPLKVPLEQINSELGESFHLALNRFLNLEKKLHKNEPLFLEYKKFIDQYIELNHGEYCNISSYDLSKDPVYFLAHHAVIREDKCSTKLRVVFDGSMLTNKKVSLNNMLLNGPVVQKDLFEILISFRLESLFFICDIRMMFRGIDLDPSQRSLQNILWRESPDEHIKCIRLKSVSYGLKSSTYLATRCLIDLAEKYEDSYPLASSILKNNTYVDDVLKNASSEKELVQMQTELVDLLALGGFQLHKWASNSSSILERVPKEKQQLADHDLSNNDITVKTLGIHFNVKEDTFKTSCPEPYESLHDTKRDILSYISKFYDPLGLIGPIFVHAKVIMQLLWASNSDWDCTPPDNIRKLWSDFVENLSKMKPISIPRCVKPTNAVLAQLIGFADASSVAYGCCLYLRSIDDHGDVHVYLLCSKSRINPCKKTLSTPRLELNAAILLAGLAKKVHTTLTAQINVNDTHLFSDSQIVLAWLKTDVAKLQTYVANRVRSIGELTHDFHWHYVNTEDNPSDCLSRGLQPHELEAHHSWWHGPTFLLNKDYAFQPVVQPIIQLPELKASDKNKMVCAAAITTDGNIFEKLKKFSSFNKLIRVLAYIVRFCKNAKPNSQKQQGFITASELSDALTMMVKHEQQHFFSDEIKSLRSHEQVKGNLTPLTPFLDGDGIIRVGGRLQNASIPYANQHPAILPKHSVITDLIVRNEHITLLHAGQKLVLSSIKQRFWIVDGLRTVKRVIHKCVICHRLKAAATTQLMGSLPSPRVNACRIFQTVGLDFAGPVSVKNSRIRKPIIGKGYIALFVCFVTKAIHLELCSDLTTECFLACFKRFIARRNLPSDVYCDNGSTFKGARNKLNEFYNLHSSQSHQHDVQAYAAQRGINFHFIPSYSPTFGGLWESSVKSAKQHLKRVVGKALLTYEQLNSVLVEIEGVLNSRPLTAVTADPNDFTYISPGHFLTGAPLNTYPEGDVSSTPPNLIRFWSITVSMKQSFWKYWSKHYLNMLQNRPKWRSVMPNVSVGTLVILRCDNIAPLDWPMARITKLFPGQDNKVRAVEVRTANGHTHKRSITKISVLPIDI